MTVHYLASGLLMQIQRVDVLQGTLHLEELAACQQPSDCFICDLAIDHPLTPYPAVSAIWAPNPSAEILQFHDQYKKARLEGRAIEPARLQHYKKVQSFRVKHHGRHLAIGLGTQADYAESVLS